MKHLRKLLFAAPAILLCEHALLAAPPRIASISSSGQPVHYEIYDTANALSPLLVLLPGTSGPEAPLYQSQAQFFAGHAYTVLVLHYFDANSSRKPSPENYRRWVTAVQDLVRSFAGNPHLAHREVVLVGYSLGASIALAAGSEGLPVKAIAEWYGSLPDEFFYNFKTMPPLLILHGARDSNIPILNAQQLIQLCSLKHLTCASHIYPDQGHGFTGPALNDADQRTLDLFAQVLHGSLPQ